MALETIYKTVNDNGEYSCGDIGISKEEWFQLLKHPDAKPYFDTLCCFLRMPEHAGTCTAVAKKFGKTYEHYNAKISNFARWVQRKLNRFKVLDTDGKETFWCIPMQKGWESKQGFVWQLRVELVEALRNYLLKVLIIWYRESKEPFNGYKEEYKWALLDETEGKGNLEIIMSLQGVNLVDNARDDSVLRTLVDTKPTQLTAVVDRLYDESRFIDDRIVEFKAGMRKICPSKWSSCANDERTASALLMCRYPQKYTAYKNEVYQLVCQYFGYEPQKVGKKFSHFIEIINGFVALYGEKTQEAMMEQIGKYKNKPLNLAIQTLLWCMRTTMRAKLAQKAQNNNEENTDIIIEEPMPQQKYKKYIELLKEARNLVLTGAPGTGKTRMAKEIAMEMGAEIKFVQFHPSYDYTDFVEGLRPIDKGDEQMSFKRRDGVFKKFCKDAIMALQEDDLVNEDTIVTENGTISTSFDEAYDMLINELKETKKELTFERPRSDDFRVSVGEDAALRIDGTPITKEKVKSFYDKSATNNWYAKHCEIIINYLREYYHLDAGQSPVQSKVESVVIKHKPFVFIIDEINRGEASKIFGELFFAIDPGYRGQKDILVQTQYQNLVPEDDVFADGFYVPENVYILATMNDIDRSVESMDFAMRRRFTWHEIVPDDTESMLDNLPCALEAKERMHRLNNAIAETDGLGAAYMIGPAYFLKLKDNGGDFEKLWKMNIQPLLKEYLRGFRKTEEILDKFSKAYFEKEQEATTGHPALDE